MGYIDDVAAYKGTGLNGWGDIVINSSDITGRGINLVVNNAASPSQQLILQQMARYAASKGVQFNVVVLP